MTLHDNHFVMGVLTTRYSQTYVSFANNANKYFEKIKGSNSGFL